MTDKFCKDCKWARVDEGVSMRSAKCTHPSAISTPAGIELVTGDKLDAEFHYASTQRKGFLESDCGPEGKFWEPSR